jgi:hypothetical protein
MPKQLGTLQKQAFEEWHSAEGLKAQRQLKRLFKEAHDAALAAVSNLYATAGLETQLAGKFILKETAMKYGRMDKAISEINAALITLRKKGLALGLNANVQAIQEGFYRTLWAYEQTIRTKIGAAPLAKSVISKSATIDAGGIELSDLWAKAVNDQAYRAKVMLIKQVTKGESLTSTTKALKAEYNKGLNRIVAMLDTNSGTSYSAGYVAGRDSATEAGLKIEKLWSHSTGIRGDDRLSHIALDGKQADKNGMFHLDGLEAPAPRMFGDPAQDYNCACTAYDVIIGDGGLKPANENEILPPQTYLEWAEPKGFDPVNGWPKVALQ